MRNGRKKRNGRKSVVGRFCRRPTKSTVRLAGTRATTRGLQRLRPVLGRFPCRLHSPARLPFSQNGRKWRAGGAARNRSGSKSAVAGNALRWRRRDGLLWRIAEHGLNEGAVRGVLGVEYAGPGLPGSGALPAHDAELTDASAVVHVPLHGGTALRRHRRAGGGCGCGCGGHGGCLACGKC